MLLECKINFLVLKSGGELFQARDLFFVFRGRSEESWLELTGILIQISTSLLIAGCSRFENKRKFSQNMNHHVTDTIR